MAEECRGEPGKVAPVVDRNCCEGKRDCVRVWEKLLAALAR